MMISLKSLQSLEKSKSLFVFEGLIVEIKLTTANDYGQSGSNC